MATYFLIGLGVYLGLTIPRLKEMKYNYTKWQIYKGIVFTLALWPIALYNNKNRYRY